MKTLFFFVWLCMSCCGIVHSQSSLRYVYDNAGNRVGRLVVSTRSFTPFSSESDNEKTEMRTLETNVNLYPNPVQTELVVAISELPEGAEWELILYNMNGKTLYRKRFNSIQAIIPMNDCAPGAYLVKIIWEQSQSVWKVFKK